jgi:hypothetical protein
MPLNRARPRLGIVVPGVARLRGAGGAHGLAAGTRGNAAIFAMTGAAKMSRTQTFNFDVAIVLDRFVFPEMRG